MMLTATIETMHAILVIFFLANGGTREMLSDDETCLIAQIMMDQGSLWIEDTDLPRQKPVGVECRCIEEGQ